MICGQHAKFNMGSHFSVCCGICVALAGRKEKALKYKEENKTAVIEEFVGRRVPLSFSFIFLKTMTNFLL